MDREEDKLTARKLLKGDRRVLRKFYWEHKPKLMAYVNARVKTSEDAEEIVQDAFLGFLDSLPLFSFRSSLWTFLVSIARHEIADYFRRLYAKKAMKYVPFVDQVYNEPLFSEHETAELFEKALNKLNREQRLIVMWKYDEKISVKEIARRLGLSMKATESRLFRARQAFQAAYAEINEQ